MAGRITLAELTEQLPDIIERIRQNGESLVVEGEGVPLVTISPPPSVGKARTFHELATRLAELPWPDDTFADDVEAAQAEMNSQPMKIPEWPS